MTEPAANLLRFGELLEWAVIGESALRKLTEGGALGGAALYPGGYRYYLREVARHVLFAAPLPSCPFGAEPKAELLRRYHVLAWTGLSPRQFRRLEDRLLCGRLIEATGARPFYPKAVIRTRLFDPLLPTWWRARTAHDSTIHATL